MTIGIAVFAPGAARAALAGLEAVEAVGRGAIGGFVSLSVLLPGGRLLDLGVQREGARALLSHPRFSETATAKHAVLMSSGPDRPVPLSQFTPCDPTAGLMTGHRLPNMPGTTHRQPNLIALEAMRRGASAGSAINEALEDHPDLDAGLIAMTLDGTIALRNSASVAARDDIGAALVNETGLSAGILHNSIFPHHALADLALSAIRDRLAPMDAEDRSLPSKGLSVRSAPRRALLLDAAGDAIGFEAPGEEWRRPEWEGCPVRRGDPVIVGERIVGHVVAETYCILRYGIVTDTRGGGRVSWKETGPS